MRFSKEIKEQIFNEIKNASNRDMKIMELAIKYNTSHGSIKMLFYQYSPNTNKRTKWNNDLYTELCEYVKANPTNLQQAFRDFAAKHNKSVHAVHLRWYKLIAPEIFSVQSDKVVTINRKNLFSIYE